MNIYVCVAWRDPNSYLQIEQICKKILSLGHNPICWVTMYDTLLDFSDYKNRDIAVANAISLQKSCNEIWVFGSKTPTMLKELEAAESKELPIIEYSMLDFMRKTM